HRGPGGVRRRRQEAGVRAVLRFPRQHLPAAGERGEGPRDVEAWRRPLSRRQGARGPDLVRAAIQTGVIDMPACTIKSYAAVVFISIAAAAGFAGVTGGWRTRDAATKSELASLRADVSALAARLEAAIAAPRPQVPPLSERAA